MDIKKEILKSGALSMLNTDGERCNQLWTPYMAWVFNTLFVKRRKMCPKSEKDAKHKQVIGS